MDSFCRIINNVIHFVQNNKLLTFSFMMSLMTFAMVCHISVRFSAYTIDTESAITWATTVLMSIVGMLVGWNIYSAIGIARDVEHLKKEVYSKIDALNSRCAGVENNTERAIDGIKEKTEQSFKNQENYFNGCIAFCQGLIQDEKHLMLKYKLFVQAMHFFSESDDEKYYIDECLHNMETTINRLRECGSIEIELDTDYSFSISKGFIYASNSLDKKQRELFVRCEKERKNIQEEWASTGTDR